MTLVYVVAECVPLQHSGVYTAVILTLLFIKSIKTNLVKSRMLKPFLFDNRFPFHENRFPYHL